MTDLHTAAKLALEALENSVDLVREDAYQAEKIYGNYPTRQGKVNGLKVLADDHEKAITALRQALEQPAQKCSYPYCGCNSKAWCKVERNEALDKMAEHARELGLDYEPAQQEPVAWMDRDGDLYANEPPKNWCPPHYPLYTTPPAAQPAPDLQAELEATNRQVEILSDALAESRREVAQLKSQPAPLQEPLTDEHIERIYHRYGGNMINCARAIERAVFAAQRQWVGLTPEEIDTVYRNLPPPVQHWQLARTIEAKLKEKNT